MFPYTQWHTHTHPHQNSIQAQPISSAWGILQYTVSSQACDPWAIPKMPEDFDHQKQKKNDSLVASSVVEGNVKQQRGHWELWQQHSEMQKIRRAFRSVLWISLKARQSKARYKKTDTKRWIICSVYWKLQTSKDNPLMTDVGGRGRRSDKAYT